MARTTAAAVQAVLNRDYDTLNAPSLTPYIDTASLVVDDMEDYADEAGVTLTSSRKEIIERWLAAHFYCQSDRPYDEKTTDGSRAKFSGKTGMRFDSTTYGQSAMTLDPSGYLRTAGSEESEAVGGFSLADDTVIDTTGDTTTSGPAPTIVAKSINRNAASTVYYIDGTDFDSVASDNTVTFNLGAVGTVIAATATRLTVTMTTLPAVGNLLATVSNSSGTSGVTQVATVVATALVGWWPCNEGSGDELGDLSGNDNDLEKVAGYPSLTWSADSPGAVAGAGGCLSASGINIGVADTTLTGLFSGNASRTITFWYKLTGTEAVAAIYTGTAVNGRVIGQAPDGSIFSNETIVFADDNPMESGAFAEVSAPSDAADSVWTHYAFIWDGLGWKFYENAVLVGSSNVLGVLTTDVTQVFLSLWADGANTAKIKDVRIYDSDIPVS